MIRKLKLVFPPILFFLLGCNWILAAAGTNPATQTALAFSVIQYSTSAGGRFPSATGTPQGVRPHTPTATMTPPPTDTDTPTETFTPTPTATVAHSATPPGTTGTTRYITDPETRDYAPQKKAPSGSDVYQNNRYERPYTAETMEYLSDVDLTRVEMRITPPWVYITFFISGTRADGIGKTMYGAEFDVNRDGRGEFLIWGASPPGAEWTTDGVEVWKDTNADVGGPNPQMTNAPWTGGNGYDQNLFAGGRGPDPDLAWIRQLPGGTKIQLAFKYSAIGNASQFLWNGLADLGVRRPDWFDYNDHFTQAEAGSPLPIQADYYPLQALYGIDNTCRDAFGFAPTGNEPGLCIYSGTISGEVFYDGMTNGVIDPGETGVPDMTVVLGQGGCPSASEKTALTNAEGIYSFPDLPQGPYCVRFINTALWNINTTPNPAAVTLPPGGTLIVNFGTGHS